jgi:uncharacterized damage-inducible protein DinB
MTRPLLEDAFAHHVWATQQLIDACLGVAPERLEATASGTFGSIIETLRHLVGADAAYLFSLTGGRRPLVNEKHLTLAELREVMEADGKAWAALLGESLDPDAIVVRRRPDGSEGHAPAGIRLAQALHHGTDHRSQVCTILTTLGIEPPAIDVWDFADGQGRLREVPPPA